MSSFSLPSPSNPTPILTDPPPSTSPSTLPTPKNPNFTPLPNDPPPSTSQSTHPIPKDANFTPLPNDPPPLHSKSPHQTAKGTNFPTLPNDPLPSTSKSPERNPKDAIFTRLPKDPPRQNDGLSGSAFAKNYVVASSIVPRYELCVPCEKMDWEALISYVKAEFKDRVMIQAELPGALRCAPNAAEMVLRCVERHYLKNEIKDDEFRRLEEKEWNLFRKSCVLLLKQLRVAAPIVYSKTRERALKVAKEWKERMLVVNPKFTLGVLGFFHFLIAYGLVSEFSMDELAEFSLMPAVADNEEFPELCRIIGLTDRVPDIVQKLIKRGKHNLAVKYIFEFNIADMIPPVSILGACVDGSKNIATRLSEEGKSLMEITAREIRGLKSAMKIIENHKLEPEYPRASLEQNIAELKRQKKSIMNGLAPASPEKPPQYQHEQKLQQQFQKREKKHKLEQQQCEIKRPRKSTPVGPAAALKNDNNGNSTIYQYHHHHGHLSGVFSEHQNPYMSLPAMPFGMVSPTQIGPWVGPYGLAGVPTDSFGNPSLGGSHLNSSEVYVPHGYYDGASNTYGVVGLQPYYQGPYWPHY